MKRVCGLLCCGLLFLSMSACAERASGEMYIEAAQLTEEEKDIAGLLGLNQGHRIYDFQVDDTVRSMQVNTYELVDGKWNRMMGGGGQSFVDQEGRIALGFENIADGLRVAVQSEHSSGATSHSAEMGNDIAGMGRATSALAEKEEIVYDREIPLVIQIITSKDEVSAYSVDHFFQPEEYEKYGYEHVYAITVLFSQKTVEELSEKVASGGM